MGYREAEAASSKENRGAMGLLFVFVPEDQQNKNGKSSSNSDSIVDKGNVFSSSSPSPSPNTSARFIRRTSSSLLFTKAQSTISICALLVFLTLLLFTVSTFEPTLPTPTTIRTSSRRFLVQKTPPVKAVDGLIAGAHPSSLPSSFWFFKMWGFKPQRVKRKSNSLSPFALQRMGTLYRRGSRATNDLVVGHVVEDVTEDELRLFLRALHRSGVTAKADIVFIFGSSPSSPRFGSVIEEENESFTKLVNHYKGSNKSRDSALSFDVTPYVKFGKRDIGESLWGKKTRPNFNNSAEGEVESTLLSYGSVVGFEANELDPENSLAGFLDHVPMGLRRWACYPMLLGRVRRNFKHIMLLDLKNLVLLGDPLGRVRNRRPESVYISMKPESSSNKHNKRSSDKTHSRSSVNSAILMGGARGIRRLSNAMLTEIVRTAMQHKKKNSVSESAILSQLVGNGYILKNVDLIASTEPIPDASSLTAIRGTSAADYSIIQRGNGNNHDLNSIIMKQICSCEIDSSVYRDC